MSTRQDGFGALLRQCMPAPRNSLSGEHAQLGCWHVLLATVFLGWVGGRVVVVMVVVEL